MEIIELTGEILGRAAYDGGLHRRFLAGLDSILGRATNPTVEAKRPGRPAPSGHSDHDIILSIEPGETTGRQVDGWIDWPVHVSCADQITWEPHYDSPWVDLIVWSADGLSNTRFVGSVPYDMGEEGAQEVRMALDPEIEPEIVAVASVGQQACRTMLAIARRAALATAVSEAPVATVRRTAEVAG